jgi:hypothetical protein
MHLYRWQIKWDYKIKEKNYGVEEHEVDGACSTNGGEEELI